MPIAIQALLGPGLPAIIIRKRVIQPSEATFS